jgi:drug/metabolite transporter (DMT)-like permease
MYSYVQPIIATTVSIIIGMDILTWQKVIATIAVFSGVILVNKSRAKQE